MLKLQINIRNTNNYRKLISTYVCLQVYYTKKF